MRKGTNFVKMYFTYIMSNKSRRLYSGNYEQTRSTRC